MLDGTGDKPNKEGREMMKRIVSQSQWQCSLLVRQRTLP